MALLARTKNPHHEAVTFFGDIAQMDLGLYRDKIQSMSSTDLDAEFIEQIHTCAVICGNKHFWARWTLLLFFGSLGILLAAYVRLGLG